MRGALVGEPVDIYWNLHIHTFSVRARSGTDAGRVIDHVPTFILSDARFIVQPRGREKVLVTRRKNVHAFVRGIWQEEMPHQFYEVVHEANSVRYNPYEAGTYTTDPYGHAVYGAETVVGFIGSDLDKIRPKLQAYSLDFSLRKW